MPVDPMYIPGRLRTGSRPSRTWMSSAEYPPSPFRVAMPAKIGDGCAAIVSLLIQVLYGHHFREPGCPVVRRAALTWV